MKNVETKSSSVFPTPGGGDNFGQRFIADDPVEIMG